MKCEKCGGTGFILRRDSEGRDWARYCECRGRMISESRIKASGIGEAFKDKTIDNFNDKNLKPLAVAKEKAKDYIDKFESLEHKDHNSILFLGQVGSGKTHLSMAIANELMTKKNVSVVYMPYRETMTQLRQMELRDKHSYDELMHKLTFSRVLVIDDLYKGKLDEKEINYMFQIINTRYLNKMPFICSSEKSHLEIIDIDEGIGSRLIEQAKGHSCLLEGKELNHRIHRE